MEAGGPGDLPAVALGIGDVPGATAPRAVDDLADLAGAGRGHRPHDIVDLVARVDVEGEGVAAPAVLGQRLAGGSLGRQVIDAVERQQYAAEEVRAELIAGAWLLDPAQAGVEGPHGRHLPHPEGDEAEARRDGGHQSSAGRISAASQNARIVVI